MMRRRAGDKGIYMDEEAVWVNGRQAGDKASTEDRKACLLVCVFILVLVMMIAAALASTSLARKVGEDRGQFKKWFEEPEDAVFNNTRAEIANFRANRTMPTFGLTQGKYHYMDGVLCDNCASRLRNLCGFEVLNATRPPLELIIPGRLSLRHSLSERSQCFMWYANNFWTRPTGGKAGFLISRIGAGLDNKTWLVEALHEYERAHGCEPYTVYPPTVELGDERECTDFFERNERWAKSADALWFIKASDGSTGRHISLMRRQDVEHAAGKHKRQRSEASLPGRGEGKGQVAHPLCPLKGGVASLEVPDIHTIRNKKYDNRVFLLVPSIQPLVGS
jgi:hypothetical protein